MIRDVHPSGLFIGNARDARDVNALHAHRIAAVVDLAMNEPPAQLPREMIYCRFPLTDGYDNSDEAILLAIRCVRELLGQNVRTLVACSAGMSRSPAIAAAAVAMSTGQSLDVCLSAIAAHGPHDVSPSLWDRIISVYNLGLRLD